MPESANTDIVKANEAFTNTELAALLEPPPEVALACQKIDCILNHVRQDATAHTALSSLSHALRQSALVALLERLLTTEVLAPIMAASGSGLTIETDKDTMSNGDKGPGYSVAITRQAIAVGLVKGCLAENNEIKILHGRFYAGKNYWRRLLRELPDLSLWRYSFTDPRYAKSSTGRSVVTFTAHASWTYQGTPETYDTQIMVTPMEGRNVTPGLAIGLAESALFKIVYGLLTGCGMDESNEESAGQAFIEGEVVSPQAVTPIRVETLEQQTPPADPPPVGEVPRNDDQWDASTGETPAAQPSTVPAAAVPPTTPKRQPRAESAPAGGPGEDGRKLKAIQALRENWRAASTKYPIDMKRVCARNGLPDRPGIEDLRALPAVTLEAIAAEVRDWAMSQPPPR